MLNLTLSSLCGSLQPDITYPCGCQLKDFKTGNPLTSITWLYCRLRWLHVFVLQVTCFVFLRWQFTSFELIAGSTLREFLFINGSLRRELIVNGRWWTCCHRGIFIIKLVRCLQYVPLNKIKQKTTITEFKTLCIIFHITHLNVLNSSISHNNCFEHSICPSSELTSWHLQWITYHGQKQIWLKQNLQICIHSTWILKWCWKW